MSIESWTFWCLQTDRGRGTRTPAPVSSAWRTEEHCNPSPPNPRNAPWLRPSREWDLQGNCSTVRATKTAGQGALATTWLGNETNHVRQTLQRDRQEKQGTRFLLQARHRGQEFQWCLIGCGAVLSLSIPYRRPEEPGHGPLPASLHISCRALHSRSNFNMSRYRSAAVLRRHAGPTSLVRTLSRGAGDPRHRIESPPSDLRGQPRTITGALDFRSRASLK